MLSEWKWIKHMPSTWGLSRWVLVDYSPWRSGLSCSSLPFRHSLEHLVQTRAKTCSMHERVKMRGPWCHSCTSQNPQLRHHCTCQRCLPGPASFPQVVPVRSVHAGLGSSCTARPTPLSLLPLETVFNRGSNRRVSYHGSRQAATLCQILTLS